MTKRPTMNRLSAAKPKSRVLKHTVTEDAQGFLSGTMLCALGVLIMTHAGLITGQTAGVAVILSYLTGWSFGLLFFLVNLPFYALALHQMGTKFTIKSFIAVALLSGMTLLFPRLFVIQSIDIVLAAILSGALVGFGLIMLFRHGGSLGGIGVVGLWAQDKFGVQAGWVQLGFDLVLYSVAFFIYDPRLVGISLLGAVVLNVSIGINHRRDRYIVR